MKAVRGKVSNLYLTSRVFDTGSSLFQTGIADYSSVPMLMGLRLFSSTDEGQLGKCGTVDDSNHRNYDNDNFFGNDGENFNTQQNGPLNPIPGRPLRLERRLPPFQQSNSTNNYRRRVKDDSNQFSSRQKFSKPLSRERENWGSKLSDDVLPSDDVKVGNVDFENDGTKKQNSQPPISDFLSSGIKGEREHTGPNCDSFGQFKLRGAGKKQVDVGKNSASPPEEENGEERPSDPDLIFKKMKETGLIPNAVAMVDGLCKDGLAQEALKLFGLMREKGTMPEVVVYTAVVDVFCQAQKLDDAKRIFRKMQANGITPNAFSYTVLIKGLCKCKRLVDAVDFCVEMLEAGHSPNITTVTGLVHEFCKEKGVDDAQKVIDALKQKGLYLDEKAVRDHLEKKGPSSSKIWDAIFGRSKTAQTFL